MAFELKQNLKLTQQLIMTPQLQQAIKLLQLSRLDLVDAGEGELVLSGHGSSARQTYLTKDCPVDAVVMAVIDHLDVDGKVVFRKE